jgi:hypothetical protein
VWHLPPPPLPCVLGAGGWGSRIPTRGVNRRLKSKSTTLEKFN